MTSVGFFGKIPSAGDFVSRQLSPAMCDRLDHLLQSALMSATSDGVDRHQVMDNASPVMLSIRPGALCETGFSGVWYPSCDRVGRVFPLCVGIETGADTSRMPLIWPSPQLTRTICQLVARALQQGASPDELLSQLPSVESWTRMACEDVPFGDVGEETVPAVSVEDSNFCLEGPESKMPVTSRALCSRLPWVVEILGTVVGPNGESKFFFGSRSLLSWASFAALFDGRWNYWGWVSYGASQEPPKLDSVSPEI